MALAELCASYWYPLYAFARRFGRSSHDAQDLTQGFFLHVLEKNLFASAQRELGKLRTFMLAAFQRYMGDIRDRDGAQKRGGGSEILSLDASEGEERYAIEPMDGASPELLFERSWALATLQVALDALRSEESAAGREEQFSRLEPFISLSGAGEANYPAVAEQLSLSQDALRKAVSRLRERFRDALRRQIADTLSDPTEAQIEEEMSSLRAALSL